MVLKFHRVKKKFGQEKTVKVSLGGQWWGSPVEKQWIKAKYKKKNNNNGWKTLDCKLVKTEKNLTILGTWKYF